jgi:hypothetical protein
MLTKINRKLYKLHELYGKHKLVPLAPGNGFHYCLRCGCWFDDVYFRGKPLYRLVRRRMFTRYCTNAISTGLPAAPPALMRSFGGYLKHIGLHKHSGKAVAADIEAMINRAV